MLELSNDRRGLVWVINWLATVLLTWAAWIDISLSHVRDLLSHCQGRSATSCTVPVLTFSPLRFSMKHVLELQAHSDNITNWEAAKGSPGNLKKTFIFENWNRMNGIEFVLSVISRDGLFSDFIDDYLKGKSAQKVWLIVKSVSKE